MKVKYLSDEIHSLKEKNNFLKDKGTQSSVSSSKAPQTSQSQQSAGSSKTQKKDSYTPNLKPVEHNKPTGGKVAYLTFDDGPSDNTLEVLKILRDEKVPATFFVNGKEGKYEKYYKYIVDEGHVIGNHTYTHNYSKIYSNVDTFMQDFTKLENHVTKHAGSISSLVRFPGGSNNTVSKKHGSPTIMSDIAAELERLGYKFFDWNVDSKDASGNRVPASSITRNVLDGSKKVNQAVILMHDSQSKKTTVEALPDIIRGLKEQGFEFDKLNFDTYSPQFLYSKY